MKTIAVLYKTRENSSIIEYLNNILANVFQGYVKIESYFATELEEGEKISADAYLLVHDDMMYGIKNHIVDHTKVVTLKRSINKESLPLMMKIPRGETVYVINDSYNTEIDTIYMLCEIGVTHLKLIPFSDTANNVDVNNIKYVITPNEPDLVPKGVDHVYNIGFREISFNTLFALMQALKLNNDVINRNIRRYSRHLAERSTENPQNYYEGILKKHLLDKVVDKSIFAILLLNSEWKPVYYNKKIDDLIDNSNKNIVELIGEDIIKTGEEYYDYPVKINNETYILDKTKVNLVEDTIGYVITLKNERSLRDIESSIKNTITKRGLVAKYRFGDIVYRSDVMQSSIEIAKKTAVTDNTILINGESGTGKELLAQSIHNYSNRNSGPFVAVNCAAIPESLIESELFGYEKGSFTGAQKNGKIGYFEQANGGTLFLDEIGNISPNFQTILLRAIQERQIIRVGGNKVVDVDVRIIAATNADLEEDVKEGKFRGDLYYRLNVIPITLASLKYRREDILPLMRKFMKESYESLTDEDKDRIVSYDWPGNIRELKNACIYYMTLGKLPDYIYAEEITQNVKTVIEKKSLPNKKDIATLLLKIIRDETQPFHGIGRGSMLESLKREGVEISDGKLRVLIEGLASKNLIEVSHGRSGTRITELGENFLKEHIEN